MKWVYCGVIIMKRLFSAFIICLFGTSALWAATPACSSSTPLRSKSVIDYRFEGSSTLALTSQTQVELVGLTPLADFLSYAILDSFSSECQWTHEQTHFRVHRANSGLTTWSKLDSSLWVRHIDDVELGSSPGESWTWFLPDTAGWDTVGVSTQDYLIQDSLTRWYAFYLQVDTSKSGTTTTIGMKGQSRIRLDSAAAVASIFTAWQANELTGHKYLYKLQLLRVEYGTPIDPVNLKGSIGVSALRMHNEGSRLEITAPESLHGKTLQVFDLQGRQINHLRLQSNQVITLPAQGVYVFRILGMPGVIQRPAFFMAGA